MRRLRLDRDFCFVPPPPSLYVSIDVLNKKPETVLDPEAGEGVYRGVIRGIRGLKHPFWFWSSPREKPKFEVFPLGSGDGPHEIVEFKPFAPVLAMTVVPMIGISRVLLLMGVFHNSV